jgi:hypoxanthine phosphoribosyltransferase
VPIAYTGFQIPDKFVFGYGLDLDEYWRNLPFVAVAKTGV